MIIYLTGKSDYLANRSLKQLKERYLLKNDSAELQEIDPEQKLANWADLLTVPLFASTRLVIVRRAGSLNVDQQSNLSGILAQLPSSTVLAVWDETPLKEPLLSALSQAADKRIALAELSNSQQIKLSKEIAARLGEELSDEAARQIVKDNGPDLWAIDSAVFGFVAGGGHFTSEQSTANDNFLLLRQCERGDFSGAATTLKQEYSSGKPMELLVGSMAAGLRKSRLSSRDRLRVVDLLSDVDLAMKTGLIDDSQAVALLSVELPTTSPNRLQWEVVHDEINS